MESLIISLEKKKELGLFGVWNMLKKSIDITSVLKINDFLVQFIFYNTI